MRLYYKHFEGSEDPEKVEILLSSSDCMCLVTCSVCSNILQIYRSSHVYVLNVFFCIIFMHSNKYSSCCTQIIIVCFWTHEYLL